MAENVGLTLERAALEIGRALRPLTERLDSVQVYGLFLELGVDFPSSLTTLDQFTGALSAGGTTAAQLGPLLRDLAAAIHADDALQIVEVAATLIDEIARTLDALDDVAVALDVVADSVAGVDPDDVRAFASGLARRLAEFCVVGYLEAEHPIAARVFQLLGVIELVDVVRDPLKPRHVAHCQKRVRLENLGRLFRDPEGLLRDLYDWGSPGFDGILLLDRLRSVLAALSIPTYIERPSGAGATPSLRVIPFSLTPRTDLTPPGLELGLRVPLSPFSEQIRVPFIVEGWSLELEPKLAAATGTGIVVQPSADLASASSSLHGDFLLRFVREPLAPAPSVLIFGLEGGSRLEAQRVSLGGGASFRASPGAGIKGDLILEGRLHGGRLVITAAGLDGFLAKALPPREMEVLVDVALVWSPTGGLRFEGGAGLSTTISVNADLGVARIDSVSLGVAAESGGVSLETSITGSCHLGPVLASFQQVGVRGVLAFQDGNLGPVDVRIGFKPPTGVGILINSGPVTGGGFLAIDTDAGRYMGALQLRIYEISVSAFGVIDTKLPRGQKGFSFVILISAEFTPIQLGLGFTLNGVGGALGIHRALSKEALDGAVRSGRLDHILFPRDPVAHAPEILTDLQAFFPPAEGRYTFGPLAKIGWGTPNVIQAKLGLILELPHPVRLTLLGIVSAGLPSAEKRFVKLNLAILGQLDFEKQTFALDASLYDSDVGGFPLSGDAALRLAWGKDPNFALAIGGFNPQYQPPPGFPELRRITVDIGSGGNPRITCQAYLAVTPNTAQVGARAELTAGGHWNIYGWIGFDAICMFSPFEFRADFSAGVALRQGTRKRASVTVHGTLSGPNPWFVKGKACVSCFFFDICVGFSVALSERRPEEIPGLPNLLTAVLAPAAGEPKNWIAEPPSDADRAVALAASDRTVFDPLGAAVLRQSALPLEERISRYAGQNLAKNAIATYDIASVTFLDESDQGTAEPASAVKPVSERFARAQFQDLPDARKLSLPAYESMMAGIRIASDALRVSKGESVTLQYDTHVVNTTSGEPTRFPASYTPGVGLTEAHAQRSAAAVSGIRVSGARKYARALTASPPRVTLAGEAYTVALKETLAKVGDAHPVAAPLATAARIGPVPRGKALAILAQHLASHPGDRDALQVVSEDELVVAA